MVPSLAFVWAIIFLILPRYSSGVHVLKEQEDQFRAHQDEVNTFWVLENFFGVFLMQAGFAMLEAGTVQLKNTRNILLKNILDTVVSAVAFYATGYAFSFGYKSEEFGFSGYYQYFLTDYDGFDPALGYQFYVFMYAFCAASVTIVSGALAERTSYTAYLIYAAFHAAIVYPVVAHWVFSTSGWLSAYSSNPIGGVGFVDFAGCAVVHVVGGVAGFIGAKVVGPRIGRFDPLTGKPNSIAGYSVSVAAIGAYILWYGWFSFNGGSTLSISGGRAHLAARVFTNTAIAPCFSTAVMLFYTFVVKGNSSFYPALNGMLAGLVAITGPCSVVDPFAAAITGCLGGAVYIVAAKFVLHVLRVDDPLEVIAVHGFSGVVGVFIPVFFAKREYIEESFGYPVDSTRAGIFYGGNGTLMGVQLLGLISIVIWTGVAAGIMFWLLSILGWLRLSRGSEETGMDEKAITERMESWASITLVRNGETSQHRLRLT